MAVPVRVMVGLAEGVSVEVPVFDTVVVPEGMAVTVLEGAGVSVGVRVSSPRWLEITRSEMTPRQ